MKKQKLYYRSQKRARKRNIYNFFSYNNLPFYKLIKVIEAIKATMLGIKLYNIL